MGFLSLAHCLLNFFCTHMFIDTYINKSSNCKRENIWCVEYVFVCVCVWVCACLIVRTKGVNPHFFNLKYKLKDQQQQEQDSSNNENFNSSHTAKNNNIQGTVTTIVNMMTTTTRRQQQLQQTSVAIFAHLFGRYKLTQQQHTYSNWEQGQQQNANHVDCQLKEQQQQQQQAKTILKASAAAAEMTAA